MNEYNIPGLVAEIIEARGFDEVLNNPLAQFGPPERRYLGPTLLPEQRQTRNEYTEDLIKYRTVIANDGTRYSPVQIKQSMMTGSVSVKLGNQDIGSQLLGKDYDVLNNLLERSRAAGIPSFEAAPRVLNWADLTLLRPLLEKGEKQRWEAIVDASVPVIGDNGFADTFTYPNPTGHRVAAAGDWDSDAYDPMDDIVAGVNFLTGKGYTRVRRIITSSTVRNKMLANDKMRNRIGSISIAAGTVIGLPGRVSAGDLNRIMQDNELPPVETYDLQYRTSLTSGYFLKRNVMVLVAETELNEELDLGDTRVMPVPSTLGYYGIGVPQGENAPGRQSRVQVFTDDKPYHISGKAWQVGLPVIQEPEAIYVITTID